MRNFATASRGEADEGGRALAVCQQRHLNDAQQDVALALLDELVG